MLNKKVVTNTVLVLVGMGLVACNDGKVSKQKTSTQAVAEKVETFKMADIQTRIDELSASITANNVIVADLTDENFVLTDDVTEVRQTIDTIPGDSPALLELIKEKNLKMASNNNEIRSIKSVLDIENRQLKILLAQQEIQVLEKRVSKDEATLVSYDQLITYDPEKSGVLDPKGIQDDIVKNNKTISELKVDVERMSREFIRD